MYNNKDCCIIKMSRVLTLTVLRKDAAVVNQFGDGSSIEE